VTMSWSVTGSAGSIDLTRIGSTNRYEGGVGAFKSGGVPSGGEPISLTIDAYGHGGRHASTTSSVLLHSSKECGA
jgi:hypothetical protein